MDALTENFAVNINKKGKCMECKECSDFCFVEGCGCRNNAVLELDRKTCTSHEPKIVFSMTKKVYWASFRVPTTDKEKIEINPIQIKVDFERIESLAFYNKDNTLFLSDTNANIIYQSKVMKNNFLIDKLIIHGIR